MPPPPTPTPARTAEGARLQGRLMHLSLKALLDRVRGAREALPHLAALEAALAERGAAAIDAIPPKWRTRICSQLSSLPLADDDLPLQDLLGRLLATLDTRPHSVSLDREGDMERTVVIREISHSEFMAVAAAQSAGDSAP